MQSLTYRLGAASTLLSPPIASSIVDSDMSPNALAVAAVSIPVPSSMLKSQNLFACLVSGGPAPNENTRRLPPEVT